MSVFSYYDLGIRLRQPMLGTNPSSADVLKDHCIEKARKNIAVANKGHKKLLKSLKRYVGDDIAPEKEMEELKGIIRGQQELLGIIEEIPIKDISEIILYSEQLEERLADKLENQELYKSTVFLRNEVGYPMISSHMLLGNVKAILSILVNSQKPDEKKSGIFKSKVQLSESMSMDFKVVETFLNASNDIERDPETKERKLSIRPIRFNRMGQSIVALGASEVLPASTMFNATLRIRKGSPIDSMEVLETIFAYGKSLGLGAWRGSGPSCGSYDFKLEPLSNFKEVVVDSDLGWK